MPQAIFFPGGPGAALGPSPEAVAIMSQRLAGIAQEFESLRLELSQIALPDWSSPAAAAFRTELAERNLALATLVGAVENAAEQAGSYGLFLGTNAASGPGSDPRRPPIFGGGLVWGLDPGFR